MTEDKIRDELKDAQTRLLLCSDPVKAELIAADIHGLKAKLYYKRRSANYYRDRHNAFQRTGAGK